MDAFLDFFYNFSDRASAFVKTQDFKNIVTTFKWLFSLIALFFLGVTIYWRTKSGFYAELLMKYSYYLDKKKAYDMPVGPNTKELQDYWSQLVLRLNYQDEAHWKLAVIESDNFLDYVLKYLGYQGETMAERLQKVPASLLNNADDVWRAHKIRNNLVHDPNYRISFKQSEYVINTYARALKNLKIIE